MFKILSCKHVVVSRKNINEMLYIPFLTPSLEIQCVFYTQVHLNLGLPVFQVLRNHMRLVATKLDSVNSRISYKCIKSNLSKP